MTTDVEQALTILRERGVAGPVSIGIVLGTGLGSIIENVDEAISIPYEDLPGFPTSDVSGHGNRLVVGNLEGVPVAILNGRAHYYEAGNPAAMSVPLQVLARLGAQTVVLTNSAGSLHTGWYPGSLALITDHINFSGMNPLIGMSGDERFVSLVDAYDKRLRTRMRLASSAGGTSNLHEGVYMWISGPSFETPAEVKMAKLLGADLVGMSTVPETILARRFGLRVVAISVVTNFATGIAGGNPSHMETRTTALSGSIALKRLLRAFVRSVDSGAG